MKRINCLLGLAVFLASTATNVYSSEGNAGGATIVPIQDGLPRTTFDLKTDAASIYLEKAVLFKDNGWFTKDKEVAVTAKMTINSRKRLGSSTALTITRVYKFDVSLYEDGRIEIPLKSLPLLDTFNLSGDDYLVTSIVMDLFLSKKKEKSDFTKTLETVIEVSKKIPVPVNPYAEYASIFGDTFSQVIDKAINEGADTVPFASFGLRFLQGDKPVNFTEKPGAHAIIIGSSTQDNGIIQLEKLDAKNISYNEIEGLKYNNQRVRNNHVIVRVIASTDPWKALASAKESISRVVAESSNALSISMQKGIKAPLLSEIAKQASTNKSTLPDLAANNLEGAIRELNMIRSTNTLFGM